MICTAYLMSRAPCKKIFSDYPTGVPGSPEVRQLLALYADLGRLRGPRSGPAAYSISGLARETGLSETRLNALHGTYRKDRETRPLTRPEAIVLAEAAAGLIGVDAEVIRGWLTGEAGPQEAVVIIEAIREAGERRGPPA